MIDKINKIKIAWTIPLTFLLIIISLAILHFNSNNTFFLTSAAALSIFILPICIALSSMKLTGKLIKKIIEKKSIQNLTVILLTVMIAYMAFMICFAIFTAAILFLFPDNSPFFMIS